jgi:hypothetical protein
MDRCDTSQDSKEKDTAVQASSRDVCLKLPADKCPTFTMQMIIIAIPLVELFSLASLQALGPTVSLVAQGVASTICDLGEQFGRIKLRHVATSSFSPYASRSFIGVKESLSAD